MYFRSIFVALPVSLLFFVSVTPSTAFPTLVVRRDRHHVSMNKTGTHANAKSGSSLRRMRAKHTVQAQRRALSDLTDVNGLLGSLSLSNDQILSSLNVFSTASENVRSNPSDSNKQKAQASFKEFQASLAPLYPLLTQLAADKGLANYNKSDQIETLLKNIVNANKNALSEISDSIDADPTLGPLLGPIVYDVKCLYDEILDLTENASDAILNDLAPLLEPLIQSATGSVCRSSITPPIAGLCLGI